MVAELTTEAHRSGLPAPLVAPPANPSRSQTRSLGLPLGGRLWALHAAIVWRLRRYFGLHLALVGSGSFRPSVGARRPQNPDIAVRFIGRDEAAALCREGKLDPADVAAHFDAGQLLVASLDGDVLAGYDWFSTAPVAVDQGGIYFSFGKPFACLAYSYTCPAYRGRALSADRWDFAHREFGRQGFGATVYFVETSNCPPQRAAAKRATAQWIGWFAYIRVMGRYLRWTSRGCRRRGIRLVVGPRRG